jgi:Zn-dependent protease
MAAQAAPGWKVGRVAGVPVHVSQSWLLIAGLVTFLFGGQLAPVLGATAGYLVALGYAGALFVAVLVHEAAHAVAARAVGLPPTHIVITFWGGHTQFESEATSAGRSVVVAVVGPLANGVLAALAWVLAGTLEGSGVAGRLLLAFCITNLFLAVFNLLPGLPLDGGRVLEALVWRVTGSRSTGTLVAGWAGRVVAVLAVLYALLPLLQGRGLRLFTVVWAALIGAMLWSAAGQAIAGARIRSRAERVRLPAMMTPAVAVPAGTSLASLAGSLAGRAEKAGGGVPAVVLIDDDGSVLGVLDPAAAQAVPPGRLHEVQVEQVSRRHHPSAVLDVRLTGDALITALQQARAGDAVVLDEGRVVGVLPVDEVIAVLLGAGGRPVRTGPPPA